MPRGRGAIRAETPEVPRTLCHLDTDAQWSKRGTDSKLHVTARDAAYRLRGLAHVLYGIGLSKESMMKEMSFLGAAANDIALALERVIIAQWAEWEAECDGPVKRPPAAAKDAHPPGIPVCVMATNLEPRA